MVVFITEVVDVVKPFVEETMETCAASGIFENSSVGKSQFTSVHEEGTLQIVILKDQIVDPIKLTRLEGLDNSILVLINVQIIMAFVLLADLFKLGYHADVGVAGEADSSNFLIVRLPNTLDSLGKLGHQMSHAKLAIDLHQPSHESFILRTSLQSVL